jgi:hypothetical protein
MPFSVSRAHLIWLYVVFASSWVCSSWLADRSLRVKISPRTNQFVYPGRRRRGSSYTTRREGSVHQTSIDPSARLGFWIRLILISAGFGRNELFSLDVQAESDAEVPFHDIDHLSDDGSGGSKSEGDDVTDTEGVDATDTEEHANTRSEPKTGSSAKTPSQDTSSARLAASITSLTLPNDSAPLTAEALARQEAALSQVGKFVSPLEARTQRTLRYLTSPP